MSDATLAPRARPTAPAAAEATAPASPASPPPVLISLPHGLDLGGVTTWAVNLANGLAARGGRVVLLSHPRDQTAGQPEAQFRLAPDVMRLDLKGVPLLKDAGGDLSPYLPIYRDLVRAISAENGGRPVVYLPNILGDSFGIAAALCVAEPELLRVVAWQHADTPYDTMLLQRYESIIHRFVAINDAYVADLRERLPARARHIASVPHGVVVPPEPPPEREELSADADGRPIRLIYTGRIEHNQKRIGAYPALADELSRRGLRHEIVLVGDGPAALEIDAAAATRPSLKRVPQCPPEEVVRWLERSDCFVLASRFEGLCISRIEAMARGCVPIVTSANSGAATGIRAGVGGLVVETHPGDPPEKAARDLADAVERFLASDARAMSIAAWEDARASFSMEAHVGGLARVLAEAEAEPPRFWRASWPAAYSFSADSPSGSVPPGGGAKLREKLAELRGRRILLHGCGRHTTELAGVLAECGGDIVAVTDDDPKWWSATPGDPAKRFLGWPVVSPDRAGESGATDVVVSSWLHVKAIWERRGVYEKQGLRVHRLYE